MSLSLPAQPFSRTEPSSISTSGKLKERRRSSQTSRSIGHSTGSLGSSVGSPTQVRVENSFCCATWMAAGGSSQSSGKISDKYFVRRWTTTEDVRGHIAQDDK